jgi:hypothetical protein
VINSQIRASYWMTFPLTIVNFNHFFIQPAPDLSIDTEKKIPVRPVRPLNGKRPHTYVKILPRSNIERGSFPPITAWSISGPKKFYIRPVRPSLINTQATNMHTKHMIIERKAKILISIERPSFHNRFISFNSWRACFDIDVRTWGRYLQK